MARFQTLRVIDVEKTIRDAVVVTLGAADGSPIAFDPGQYLTFRRDFDGTEVRRSYSICSAVGDGTVQVGIKRVPGGAFSTWANDALRAGDQLEAMEAMGQFTLPIGAPGGRHYLGFAGGSGITPVLSLLRSVLRDEPGSRFTLVYANRGVHSIMFREEIEALKNEHIGRLNVIHVLESDAQDIDLFQGRVDGDKCAAFFKHWIDIASVNTALICGPEPMMLAIAQALRDHGLRDDQIMFELFSAAQPGRLPQRAEAAAEAGAPEVSLQVTLDGATRNVTMARDVSVLDTALAHALDAPYACKAGVCSTCKCKVIEGEVEMAANHALEDYEVARDYVLSCQAYAISDRVVVDYDQ